MAPRPIEFGFPSQRLVPPSRLIRRLHLFRTLCAVASGALLLSISLGVLLSVRLIVAADAIPFVADGGVAGCQVPIVPTGGGS